MHTIAVVDLGTNTFTLLIVSSEKQSFQPLFRKRTAVKLGKGGIDKNFISDEAILRAIDALLQFKDICSQFEVQETRFIGTSALRNAENKSAVLNKIHQGTGYSIEIISGNQEAEYIFKGVSYYTRNFGENYLITDIGGGSTECIIANKNKILFKESIEFGGTRLLELIEYCDPLTKKEIRQIQELTELKFNHVFQKIKEFDVAAWVGASGAFETLAQIEYQKIEEDLFKENFLVLEKEKIKTHLNTFIISDTQMRNSHPYIIPIRVEMFPVACVFIDFMLQKFDFKTIYFCGADLKEGVIAEMIQQ